MNSTIVEGRSISKPPYFDGANYTVWKEHIKIFIQSIDSDLWIVIENGPKIPKKIVDGEELVKTEDEFNDDDMQIMEQDEQAKNILCCALNPDDLRRISRFQTAKEMWEELDKQGTTLNTPNLEFLDETSDHPNKRFLDLCVPIHKHALNGNWPAAKRILNKENKLKNAAISNRWLTLLHIAAGANRIHFVKQLLKMLDNNDISLQDINGNTAFCIAAAAGNMEIVDLMLERDSLLPVIRGGNGYTPIQYAALQGRAKMTWHLYDKTIPCFEDKDWTSLFFACINRSIYDAALKMVFTRSELGIARDENGETALHLLAHHRIFAPILTNNLIAIRYRIAGVINFKNTFDTLVHVLGTIT